MILERDSNIHVKLIDFGLGQIGNQAIIDTRGSDVYLAPEIVMNLDRNLLKGDVWACGVVLFAMCTTRLPFDSFGSDSSMGSRSMYRRIATGNFEYTNDELEYLSSDAIDLVQQMLTRSQTERKDAKELLLHPFLIIN